LRIRNSIAAVAAALAVIVACAGSAASQQPTPEPGGATPLGSDVQHLHYRYGPIHVLPGQNLILIGPVTIEKPAYDGFVTRIKPNLVRADGSVPPVDVIHLHHGVFLNESRKDATMGGAERFFATGEEKTIFRMPPGYGYPVRGSDVWAVNYMVHNQTPVADDVWITYDLDYVPANSALGRTMKPVRPIWMDVRNGEAYPVFDVHRGAGGAEGKWTYPDNAKDPYGTGRPRNVWTADRNGTLVAAAGHVHPGGLWDDLTLERPSAAAAAVAKPATAKAAAKCKRAAKRKKRHANRSKRKRGAHGKRARRPAHHCAAATPAPRTSVPILRSMAQYFDPQGPISWDLAMTGSKPDWRVPIRKGDRLRVSATYDTERASWYESMGIVVAYMADGLQGPDPFIHPPDTSGPTTHGHLPENNNHGGGGQGGKDPATLPDGQTVDNRVGIQGFSYLPGDQGLPGGFGDPPAITAGKSLTFDNEDASSQIFHTVTACKAPCNRATGISYPLADGPVQFDSSELGYGPTGFTAAGNRYEWKTPPNLAPGTYTYFCRIHPYMRGAFRVKP
jgi:plastocyanin